MVKLTKATPWRCDWTLDGGVASHKGAVYVVGDKAVYKHCEDNTMKLAHDLSEFAACRCLASYNCELLTFVLTNDDSESWALYNCTNEEILSSAVTTTINRRKMVGVAKLSLWNRIKGAKSKAIYNSARDVVNVTPEDMTVDGDTLYFIGTHSNETYSTRGTNIYHSSSSVFDFALCDSLYGSDNFRTLYTPKGPDYDTEDGIEMFGGIVKFGSEILLSERGDGAVRCFSPGRVSDAIRLNRRTTGMIFEHNGTLYLDRLQGTICSIDLDKRTTKPTKLFDFYSQMTS